MDITEHDHGENALHLHDDGKGFCIMWHMVGETNGKDFSIHLEHRYPDEGMPNADIKDVEEMACGALMEFAALVDDEFREIYEDMPDYEG